VGSIFRASCGKVGVIHMLTVDHKERKNYGYYTLIIYKNGLDKPDHLRLVLFRKQEKIKPETDSHKRKRIRRVR
jgi:hypothetical protein